MTSSPAAYDGDDGTNGIPMVADLGNSSSAYPDRRCYHRNSKMSSKVASVDRPEDCVVAAAARGTLKRAHPDAAVAGDAAVSVDYSVGCAAE